jgi:endoglucanase
MTPRMRGVNFGGWFSQIDAVAEKDPQRFPGVRAHLESFLGPADFARVKAWGFDHVRLPVDYGNAFTGTELAPDEAVLGLLDRAVDGLLAAGLQVILDLHKCPGHDFLEGIERDQGFFSDPALRAGARRVWSHLAERFGHRSGVLLEILNEPVAPDAATWNAVKDEMAAHIRRHAPRATIVVGANRWNQAGEFAHLTPVPDDNVLYSFHYYLPLLFTHQFAPWLPAGHFQVRRPYPGEYAVPAGTAGRLPLDTGRWDRARMERSLEPVLRFGERYQVPVGCHEFGVYVGGADRPSQLAWMRDFLSLLRAHDLGWSYWNYRNLDFGLISRGEARFARSPQYDNPERTDRELVQLLATH